MYEGMEIEISFFHGHTLDRGILLAYLKKWLVLVQLSLEGHA